MNQRFNKNEKLCSKILISELFEKGKSRLSGCVRMIYQFTDEDIPSNSQLVVAVPKKNFRRAIKRNLLKRRIREAYRLNKNEMLTTLESNNKKVLIAFIYIASIIHPYTTIEENVKLLLKIIISEV